MALLTRSTTASADANQIMYAPQVAGDLYAGEALDAAAPCYIKNSDGLVYMSNGTAATEPAGYDGTTPQAYAVGEAVTLHCFGRYKYGTGLTPGAKYYIGATKGRLDTAATTGDAVGVARAINDTDIRFTRAV